MAKVDLTKMSYKEIEQRYIYCDIKGKYKFRNADEVKKVFGWDFRTIRGFKDLSEENKIIAEFLICNYLNGFGLGIRHKQRPTSIKFEGNKFKVNIKDDGFSYLYLNGTVG